MAQSWPWRALVHFAIAVLATIVFVVLAEAVVEGRADKIDAEVALAIHAYGSPVLDQVMITTTHVGSWPMLFVLVVAMTIWLFRHGDRRTAAILIANAVTTEMLNMTLKRVIARPRPTLFEQIPLPTSFSFPSGHAMSATAILGSLAAVLIVLHPARRTAILVATSVVVGAIGFSRVYLGVHWPSDVLAGFAAGVPLLVATLHLLRTRERDAITDADLPDARRTRRDHRR